MPCQERYARYPISKSLAGGGHSSTRHRIRTYIKQQDAPPEWHTLPSIELPGSAPPPTTARHLLKPTPATLFREPDPHGGSLALTPARRGEVQGGSRPPPTDAPFGQSGSVEEDALPAKRLSYRRWPHCRRSGNPSLIKATTIPMQPAPSALVVPARCPKSPGKLAQGPDLQSAEPPQSKIFNIFQNKA